MSDGSSSKFSLVRAKMPWLGSSTEPVAKPVVKKRTEVDIANSFLADDDDNHERERESEQEQEVMESEEEDDPLPECPADVLAYFEPVERYSDDFVWVRMRNQIDVISFFVQVCIFVLFVADCQPNSGIR